MLEVLQEKYVTYYYNYSIDLTDANFDLPSNTQNQNKKKDKSHLFVKVIEFRAMIFAIRDNGNKSKLNSFSCGPFISASFLFSSSFKNTTNFSNAR